jgi:hypothetical protein
MPPSSGGAKPRKLLKVAVSEELHQHVWDYKHKRRLGLNRAIVLMLEEHRLMDNLNERLKNVNDALTVAQRRLLLSERRERLK